MEKQCIYFLKAIQANTLTIKHKPNSSKNKKKCVKALRLKQSIPLEPIHINNLDITFRMVNQSNQVALLCRTSGKSCGKCVTCLIRITFH